VRGDDLRPVQRPLSTRSAFLSGDASVSRRHSREPVRATLQWNARRADRSSVLSIGTEAVKLASCAKFGWSRTYE
jgi:hypothetical protein